MEPPHLIGPNYETFLKESISRFSTETQNPHISDTSHFTSIFFKLLQSRPNPPLETIWFYSAATFRAQRVENDSSLKGRVLRVKDLFELLTSCSVSWNGLKSVAVLCPVLRLLYELVVELWGKRVGKEEKKALKEVERLVEGVLGYVVLSGCEDFGGDDGLGKFVCSVEEMVRVWTIDRAEGERLKVFFPLVSEEIRMGLGGGELGSGYLVGVVIVQAFLLRLCLKVRSGDGLSKEELRKELMVWAVGSMTAFKNCCFYDILLRLLMESTLPVSNLLDSKDEGFLRKVLYDVVILVDYSFLNIEGTMATHSNCMNRLALRRLIIVHGASQDAREEGDHTKAISYINAFSGSYLPTKLVKWVTSQIGMAEETIKPNLTTPQALLKWLLNLENQGIKIFDNYALKIRAKLVLDESKAGYEHQSLQPNNMEDDLLFFIDTKREREEEKADDEEMVESTENTMKSSANGHRVKRKKGTIKEQKKAIKFSKYLLDNSVKDKLLSPNARNNVANSDTEEEAQSHSSDKDMEDLEE